MPDVGAIDIDTNFVDCDLDALRIGQAVKVRFEPTEGGAPALVFAPVQG